MEDGGWKSYFQRIFILGTTGGDALAAAVYVEEPSVIAERIQNGRHYRHADVQGPHSHPDAARGPSPNPVLFHTIRRTAGFLLHRLRIDCAFTQEKLFIVVLTATVVGPSRAAGDNLEHAI